MGAYETIGSWLKEIQSEAFFPPLDESGQSVFTEGRQAAVFLYVPPESVPSAEEVFYIYMTLVSLIGIRDEYLLQFMIELAEANMVGSLPTGYRLFYDPRQKQVYLGGQFSPKGLDGPAFRQLTEEFVRYGRQQGPQFSERLTELDQSGAGPAFGSGPDFGSLAGPAASSPADSGTSEELSLFFGGPLKI
ncbi:MAG: hypothetical protein LBP22_16405 [Deltaproteobacteria bacterium]|jgi:hypothetical protein|nr:hypothetical protein [Deltaproteobacteria bacterium]